MAKFRANTDDAYILTNIQNQESGDNDWAKYQVITQDKSRLILHNNTTNSLLKVFKDTTQVHDIFGDGSVVATYTFDGNANDLGGNYNGTWSGTEQYDAGKFGQAAKFDGNSMITGFHVLRPDKGNQTVSFWSLVTDNFNNDNSWVVFSTTNNNAYDITIHPHGIIAHGTDNSQYNLTTQVDTTFINKNEFYHTVLVFDKDNTTIKLYINGVLQVVNSDWTGQCYSGSTDLTRMGYGGNVNLTTYYFNGLIDQVRIFNRALTEDEIAILYHEGLTHIRKHDQLIIYNATDGAKIHEVTSITDNDTDKTYDIDISSLSLTEAPTNAHQLTKSVDLTDKIDTSNTTATTLVLQDVLENPTLVKNGETLVIDGYKLENINVTRSLEGENVKYSVDISSLNHVPSEVVLIKPRVEISVGDEDKANADDLVLDVLDSTTTSITVGYYEGSKRARIKNAEKVDTDTGLDLSLIEVVEEYLDPTKVDPFNDNSEVAFYQLDGNANDAHNQYNGTWSGTEQYDTGVFGQAANFDGNNQINCGVINTNLDELWISFWMYWNGINDMMPIGFYRYDLYIYSAFFGWNTGSNDIYGIDFLTSEFANKWLHVVVNFKTGTYGDTMYINNISQNLSQKQGSINSSDAVIKNVNFCISGWNYNNDYRFNGLIDQVRIFNRALAEDEVKYLYNEGKYKFDLNLQSEQSSAPTKAIIRPTIQDILELDPNNTVYDNTNDLVNVYYQPIEKGNGFRSVQVKWNAHRQGDENSSLRVNLWKKVA